MVRKEERPISIVPIIYMFKTIIDYIKSLRDVIPRWLYVALICVVCGVTAVILCVSCGTTRVVSKIENPKDSACVTITTSVSTNNPISTSVGIDSTLNGTRVLSK